jgi:hypothetical protein
MTSLVIKALLGIVLAVALAYASKILLKWLQKFQDIKNSTADKKDKEQALSDNQKANIESDKLKKIDER